MISPLELLNLYYSDGQSLGNRENKLWRKMNELLSWDNILHKGYQADLCPLLYYIITKYPVFKTLNFEHKTSNLALSTQSSELSPKLNGLALSNSKNSTNPTNSMNPISSINLDVPDSILSQLHTHYRNSLKRNMILLDELKRVLQKFKENDIEVIVLKGADLAETVYPNIALRPMGDVDLLVKKKNLEDSERLLLDSGYKQFIRKDSKNHSFHNTYIRMENGQTVVIEIHWDLIRKIFYTNINVDELWAEATPINSLNKSLKLSLNHYLLYLCWHGSRHGFARLIWICDIGQLIKNKQEDINLDSIHQKSIEWKISRPLHLSLYLLNVLLHHESQLIGKNEKYSFNGLEKKICHHLALKVQSKSPNKRDPQNIINLLSWFLIQTYSDKGKHLVYRWFEIQ
jgi:hypothetical protein